MVGEYSIHWVYGSGFVGDLLEKSETSPRSLVPTVWPGSIRVDSDGS